MRRNEHVSGGELVARVAVGFGMLGIAALNYQAQHRDHEDPPAPAEYYARLVPEQGVISKQAALGWVIHDKQLKLDYAEERVFFDGSSESIADCNLAAADLAKVTLGGTVYSECTPPTTSTP